MRIDPQSLRESPQLAALELLVQAAETATIALCAAHPSIEHDLRHFPEPPIERLADHLIDRATVMLDALDRYRRLLRDLDRLRRAALDDDDQEPTF